jgi:hypothetical protein
MDEIEGILVVTAYAEMFVVAQLVSIAIVLVLMLVGARSALFGVTRRRRAFRCRLAGREVEVEFAERRIFGVRSRVAVTRCTAFESPTAVACARRCVNSAFRRQWEFAIPASGPVHEGDSPSRRSAA